MRDHDDLPYIVIEKHSGGGFGTFLWGALLGAGVALLLAPRSGEETQEEIRERVRRLREAAEDRVTGVRDSVNDSVSRTRDRIQDRIDTVRDTLESRADQARNALDEGRRAARDARSELQRRVDEARSAAADALHDDDDYGDFGMESTPPPEVEVVVTEVYLEGEEPRV
jgi:gas vesicle protein